MDTSLNELNQLTIIVAEPQAETCGLYARSLQKAGFVVFPFSEVGQVRDYFSRDSAHALLFNVSLEPHPAAPTLDAIRRRHPQLAIITLGDIISQRQMDRLMQLGIAGHCHAQLLQGRDLAGAVHSLLSLNR